MSITVKPAPVRKSIVVAASPERAFEVFTAGFDRWWPRSHSIGASPLAEAVLEPGQGGRWYGRLEDGTEALWGDVLAWDPPRRLVLAWRIAPDWSFDANLLTEVEVTFAKEGEGTRVDLEHRKLENMGAGGEQIRAQFESEGGWGMLLQLLAAEAAKAA
ncbi:MAG TPA: SRPBCC family protein [Caulobacteraceae bacterium]|nr:SRPBCC family protein [Caulobacteraceae bacterium]